MDLDFSQIDLTSLSVNTGASSLKLKLGDKVAAAKVKIKAGASSVDISLPSYIGARITINSGLSSKDFPDFDQINDQTYQSKNYDLAGKKIDFTLDIGVSKVAISWD
jgi:hypothetical protein